MNNKVKTYVAVTVALIGIGLSKTKPLMPNPLLPIKVHAESIESIDMNDRRAENTYQDVESIASEDNAARAAGARVQLSALVVEDDLLKPDEVIIVKEKPASNVKDIKKKNAMTNEERLAHVYKTNKQVLQLFLALGFVGLGCFFCLGNTDVKVKEGGSYEE